MGGVVKLHFYRVPSISPSGMLSGGILFTRSWALPRMSTRESRWKRWRMTSSSSWPWCRAREDPSFFTCSTATLWRPPKVSAATGIKSIPSALQASLAMSHIATKEWIKKVVSSEPVHCCVCHHLSNLYLLFIVTSILVIKPTYHNSHEHFLLGVTGIPDFLVNLWDWQATIIIPMSWM